MASTSRTGGVDFKMGFGPNLTLDATVNPDFGQVEADPAEVNLTAFETFFDERRPFFVEGARLLGSRRDRNFYYSRRIGALPTTLVQGDFVDYPRDSTIVGAAKLTGRLSSGTSLGFLGAVTGEEVARTAEENTPAATRRIKVGPSALWGVARIEQEFGPATSTASVMLTAVHRNMTSEDPLAARLVRNAFTASGDSLLRFRGGEYELRLHGGVTYADGEPEAISQLHGRPCATFNARTSTT